MLSSLPFVLYPSLSMTNKTRTIIRAFAVSSRLQSPTVSAAKPVQIKKSSTKSYRSSIMGTGIRRSGRHRRPNPRYNATNKLDKTDIENDKNNNSSDDEIKKDNHRPILVWDTETTGLSQATHRIVEIAIMEYDPTIRHASAPFYSSLVRPIPINQSILQNSKFITACETAPTFSEVWEDFRTFVERVSDGKRPILVAHNMAFDLRFLRAELARLRLPLPNWDFACSLRDVAHTVWPGQPASLAALVERLGIRHTSPHRALSDVEATIDVLNHVDAELRALQSPQEIASAPEMRDNGYFAQRLLEDAAKKRKENDDINPYTSAFQHSNSVQNAMNEEHGVIGHLTQRKSNEKFGSKRSGRKGNRRIHQKAIVKTEGEKRSNLTSTSETDSTEEIITSDDESDFGDYKDNQSSNNNQPEDLHRPVYVTPKGYLWHRDRACRKLDAAYTIQRRNKPPKGKKACPSCSKD